MRNQICIVDIHTSVRHLRYSSSSKGSTRGSFPPVSSSFKSASSPRFSSSASSATEPVALRKLPLCLDSFLESIASLGLLLLLLRELPLRLVGDPSWRMLALDDMADIRFLLDAEKKFYWIITKRELEL